MPPSGIPNTKNDTVVLTQTHKDDHDGSVSISKSDVADDDLRMLFLFHIFWVKTTLVTGSNIGG